jgi:hypothetical protein
MTSERSLVVVHYTGTQVGNHTPCDHLGIITKNFQRNNSKSRRFTLTQIIEILLSEPEKHRLVFGGMPGDAPIKRGEVVSLTLFVNNSQSVLPSELQYPQTPLIPVVG